MKILPDILLSGIGNGIVKRIVIGINWTMVEGEHGCGLAHTPRRDSPGCRPISGAGQLIEMDLRKLAEFDRSTNPIEVAVGMAAINASYNRFDLDAECGNGLDTFGTIGKSMTVVGRFPGLEERYSFLKIIEKEPCEGEYPESMAKELLNSSPYSIITASTLVNGTAEDMISYANAGKIAFIGPGTPLCPMLFELGVNVLSGMIVTNTRSASRIIAEGGAVQALKKVGRYATIRSG